MKHTTKLFLAFFALCLAPALPGQEITIDPETGQPKMSKDNPDAAMEQIFKDGAYDTGAKTFALKFEADDPDWTLPALQHDEAVKLNKAAIAISKGDKAAVKVLGAAKEKATPHFWNLISGKLHAQKAVAAAAAAVPSNNGEALAYRMLMSEHKEIRDPAWKRFDKMSPAARIGVWVRSNNKDVRAEAANRLMGKKDKKAYLRLRDELKKSRPKRAHEIGFSKSTPSWLANLFVDHLLDAPELYWDHKKKGKLVDKLMGKSKASKDFKALAAIRFGSDKINTKLSRSKDWYVRGAYCRALRHRTDLAWDPKVVESVLERVRDVNLQVRQEAIRTIRALHPLPMDFGRDRFLVADSDVIADWERWWLVQKDLAKQFKGIEKQKAYTLKKVGDNKKVFFGASTKNFPVYKCISKEVGTFYLIDVDGDGRFSLETDRYLAGKKRNIEKHANTPLSRVLSDGKKLFLVDIDQESLEVRFKPYKGKTHKVAFTSKYGPSHKAVGVTVSSAPDMNFPVSAKGETALPPGDYKITAGWVIKKGAEVARILDTKATSSFAVDKDTKEKKFGGTLDLTFTHEFDESTRILTISPVEVTGEGGEVYRKISPQLDNIKVELHSGDRKTNLRDWEKKYMKIETAMLGGLTPPLKEGQVHAMRGLYENYERDLLAIQTCELELVKLELDLTTKEAQLNVEKAKPVENQDAALIAQLQAEVDDLKNVQIPGKKTQITTKTTEKDTKFAQLTATGGMVGMSFKDFIDAVYREEGVKFLAQSMSDIYWTPYTVEMGKIKIAEGADKVTLRLQSKVAFGEMKERIVEIQLKPPAPKQ